MDCDGGRGQRYQGGAHLRRRDTCTYIVLYTPVRKVFGGNRGMIRGDVLSAVMYYGGSSRYRGQSELRPKSPGVCLRKLQSDENLHYISFKLRILTILRSGAV